MNVFISWSGKRSKALANELASWLQLVIQNIKPWVSNKDIRKGERWFIKIGEKLKTCDIGLICVTPENVESPWLLFETGALSKQLGEAKVCPILMGMNPSDLDGPLAQFQATSLVKDDMLKLLFSLNDELKECKLEKDILVKSFNKFWGELEDAIKEITKIGIKSSNFESVIKSLNGKGFSKPEIGRIVAFNDGFESHSLYETVFSLSQERIYIFGRKNRKVFDKEHYDFFKSLGWKINNGFDFKCLFLNPNSPAHVIHEAHEDEDFIEQLKVCSQKAISVLKSNNIDPEDVCRTYNVHRTHAFVISDNTLIFTPLEVNSTGQAKHITKCKFQVIDLNLPLGQELLENFEELWSVGSKLS